MKKIKKTSLGFFILFASVYVAFLPHMAKGLEGEAFKLVVENNIALRDKLLISYDIDGTINTKIIPYDIKTDLVDPYKEGYTFKGWQTDEGSLFDKDTLVKEDINLKAIFEADSYKIDYELHGGQAENPNSYTIEDKVRINNPTKTGYTFEGWMHGFRGAYKKSCYS